MKEPVNYQLPSCTICEESGLSNPFEFDSEYIRLYVNGNSNFQFKLHGYLNYFGMIKFDLCYIDNCVPYIELDYQNGFIPEVPTSLTQNEEESIGNQISFSWINPTADHG